jgi:predicted phosphoribosyltransferase
VSLLERAADRVLVLHVPEGFGAVGAYFDEFEAVSDEDVRRSLRGDGESDSAHPAT